MEKVKLSKLAAEHGVENLRIFCPARRRDDFLGFVVISGSNPAIVQECRIKEDARPNRAVEQDYRVIIAPLDPDFVYEDFYNGDFESLSQQYPEKYYVMVGETKYVLGFPKTCEAA